MSTGPGLLTLGRWVRDRARTTPDRIAIDFRDEQTTYDQLDRRSERRAADPLARGIGRGDRVACLTGNSPEHVELLFACAKTGVMLLPLSWRLTPTELAYQLDDAEPALLLVTAEHRQRAEQALALARCRPPLEELLAPAADEPVQGVRGRGANPGVEAAVQDDDGLLLLYTSGTTGRPKGAVLTHANCFWTNLSLDRTTDLSADDVVLQVLPQFHVGGWNVQPLLAWWKGATVVLEPGFDPERTLRVLVDKRVSTMMGVPTTYLLLARQPGFADADLSGLRRAVVGGAPMPPALLRTWQARGVEMVQGYGLTEAAPNVPCLPAEQAVRKLGSAGKAYPHVEVAVADLVTGQLQEGPCSGELLVRGPNVFAGYWNNPEATAEALRDGWLHTGDVVRRDAEGFFTIQDRLDDMYVAGGENVYPAEVESVLYDHPAVAEVAVIAVPDSRWGAAGLAAVVLHPQTRADAPELIEHCRARLAGFKVPREVRFVQALPSSGVGKVLKTALRVQFADAQGPW